MALPRAYLDPVTGEPSTPTPGTAAPSANFQTQAVGDQGPDPYDPGSPGPQAPPAPPAPPAPAPAPDYVNHDNPNITPVDPTTGSPQPTNPNTGTATGVVIGSDTWIDNWLQAQSTMPGVNPSVGGDPGYWKRRFRETGGITAANRQWWETKMRQPEGAPEGGGGPPPPAAGGGGGGGSQGLDPSISAFFNAQTANLAAQQARDAEIRAIIRSRLALAQQPVDENSAEVTQPLLAARNEATRAQDSERTALAERLYAQGGLNTNALGQQIQQSSERNALGLGNLRAGLISHVADAKRQELQALLQMATAQGDSESARTIQAQIAALNASVTSQGQGIGLAEFLAQLNQNSALAGLRG